MFKNTIIVCSHDAGGAEVVSAWVKVNSQHNYMFYLAGPAHAIFKKKLKNLLLLDENEFKLNIKKATMLICSTGINSNFEKQAMLVAKENHIKIVAYLDHWVNYRIRFVYNNKFISPDEIWIGDRKAYNLACKVFPEMKKITFVKNQYFKEIKQEFRIHESITKHENVKHFLLIGEPLHNRLDTQEGQWPEIVLFSDYIQYLISTAKGSNIFIKIRPHPNENEKKYSELIATYSKLVKINLTKESTLTKDLAQADYIVGFDSMALYVALLCNKKVMSLLPSSEDLNIPSRRVVRFESIFDKKVFK